MSLLEVRSLSVAYGDIEVISGLDFDIDRDEAVGLIGESGSGKSQTAQSILGLLPRSARVTGSIRFDGTELLGAPEASLNALRGVRLAMIFQDPMQALNPFLTVSRQLTYVLKAHGLASGEAARSRVCDMLGRVRLPDPANTMKAYPHELSGGMRQRVMIAAALLAEPDLLVADEPTTALDVTVQAQILDLLDELREDTALLLITHDLGIVAGRCERVLVLERGSLVETAPMRSIFSSPQHDHTKALLATAKGKEQPDAPVPGGAAEVFAVTGAEVVYPGRQGDELRAVHGVDATLARGETLAIVGESGAGKSSLARAAVGLVPLDAGRVVLCGATLGRQAAQRTSAARRDLQLVFQDPVGSLNPQMPVASILAEPIDLHMPALSVAERRLKVIAALLAVGLDERYLERFPHQLSGGQASRVAIARALIVEPKVLVCDEAVASLDGRARGRILDLFGEIQKNSGLAIIFITHDLAVARQISHRVLVLYLGRALEYGSCKSLFTNPLHPYTQALLDAVPKPDPDAPGGRASIGGEVPSLRAVPTGCVFHPRCAQATGRCSAETPILRTIAGVNVACHYASAVSERP